MGRGTLPDLPAQIWDHCPGDTPVPKDGPKSGFSILEGSSFLAGIPEDAARPSLCFLFFFSTSFSGLPPKSLKEHGRVENVVGKGGETGGSETLGTHSQA